MESLDLEGTGSRVEFAKKLGKLKDSCRPRSLYRRLKGCDVHLYMVTFWGCLGFIGLVCLTITHTYTLSTV